MNNDGFTVLVNGVSRCHCVSMCTVWLWHSKWLSKQSNKSASNFVLSLNIPPWKIGIIQKASAGDWQLLHDYMLAHAPCLVQSFLVTHQITQVTQPRFGTLRLLAFSKTEITLEREEISDCQWDSGKYDKAADGDLNCVRSQGAHFEGDWVIIVLCTVFLVS